MPKTAKHKLSSEQRCEKAFLEWFVRSGPVTPIAGPYYDWQRNAWNAAWKYLESRVSEFVQS